MDIEIRQFYTFSTFIDYLHMILHEMALCSVKGLRSKNKWEKVKFEKRFNCGYAVLESYLNCLLYLCTTLHLVFIISGYFKMPNVPLT